MDSPRSKSRTIVISILLTAILYGSSFLIEPPHAEYPFSPLTSGLFASETSLGSGISRILAALAIIVSAVVVGASVPSVYPAMAFIAPLSVTLTPIHCAALAFALSLMALTRPVGKRNKVANSFSATLMLGVSALFFVPIIWLFPLFLVLLMSDSDDKRKTAFASLAGVILPITIVSSLAFVIGNPDAATCFSRQFEVLISAIPRHFSVKLLTVIRIVLTIGLILSAGISIMKRMERFTVQKYRVCVRIISVTAVLSIICAIYLCRPDDPYGILISLPASVLLCEFFTSNEMSAVERTATAALILTVLAERITYLI